METILTLINLVILGGISNYLYDHFSRRLDAVNRRLDELEAAANECNCLEDVIEWQPERTMRIIE